MAERASFTIEIECGCRPPEAIRRILDLREHSRVIPLTTVTPAVAADELRVGSQFVARTGLGPVGFNDVMRVEELRLGDDSPTASARISKHSRAIRGSIRLLVTPMPGGSFVRWHHEVQLPWLPGFLQRPAAQVLKLGYRSVLGQLLAVSEVG